MLYFHEDDDLVLGIDYSWSTDHSLGLRGYVLPKTGQPADVFVESSGVAARAVSRFDRPELATKAAEPSQCANAGFWIVLPVLKEHQVVVRVRVDGTEHVRPVTFRATQPERPSYTSDVWPVWDHFVACVNDEGRSVLEIGSRDVSPGGATKRVQFPGAASYTGFDYYGDENTDVVGDAHRLSSYFQGRRFGASFSFALLEHLAMPWLFPIEVNKVLEPGGLTMHCTHQAWPAHELPWDFFRFSDNALRVLFCRALGFETVSAGMFAPVRVYFDDPPPAQEAMPSNPAFGGSFILARKTAEVDESSFRWPLSLDELSVEFAGTYPLQEPTPSDEPSGQRPSPGERIRQLWRRFAAPG